MFKNLSITFHKKTMDIYVEIQAFSWNETRTERYDIWCLRPPLLILGRDKIKLFSFKRCRHTTKTLITWRTQRPGFLKHHTADSIKGFYSWLHSRKRFNYLIPSQTFVTFQSFTVEWNILLNLQL